MEGDTRVFRIRGTSEEDVRACQQEAVAGSLESDDVFLVMQGDKTWLWEGKVSLLLYPFSCFYIYIRFVQRIPTSTNATWLKALWN